MSILSDIGASLLGTTVADLQAQATVAETQLQLAIGTMIALEAIIVVELFLLVVMSFKARH
jgi:hypothetical protein